MTDASAQIVGLVAGAGRLPFALARGARRAGRRVLAIGFEGFADPALGSEVEALSWVHIGELGALFGRLADAGIREVVVAGHVPKAQIYANPAVVRVDERGAAFLARLRDRSDDAILRALGDAFEAEGIRVAPQTRYAGELIAPAGVLGAVVPSAAQHADVTWGWPLAKAIGRLDIGQTLVVKDKSVLAVEAVEGTDAAIRRGATLGRGGVAVLKVFKPDQDPRFDAPTIGPETIATLAEAGATLLAVEAGRTLILDRPEVVAAADGQGIALLGVPEAGPS